MKTSFNSVIRNGVALAAVFVTFSAVNAADAPESPKTKFQTVSPAVLAKYDTNKDLVLSESEIEAMHVDIANKKALAEAKRLKKFDTNKDGKLDESELAVEVAGKAEKKAAAAEKRAEKKAEKAGKTAGDQVADNAPSSK